MTSHSRLCMITFNLCKIFCPLLAEAALEAQFHIRRSSALSGVMIGLISINDGKLDCFKQCWMWCQKIFNRRWRMHCDSFSISLCTRLLPQGGFPHLFGDVGPPGAKAMGSCPFLSCVWCSSCLLMFQGDKGQCYIGTAVSQSSRHELQGKSFPPPCLLLAMCISFSEHFVFFCRQKKLYQVSCRWDLYSKQMEL